MYFRSVTLAVICVCICTDICMARQALSDSAANVGSFAQSIILNPFAASRNPCANIRNGQFVCLDCATLAFCLQENEQWVTIAYETCRTDKSMYCDQELKGCRLQRECTLPSYGMKFECQNPGKYPDPYDCKYYHECSDNNEDKRYVCSGGLVYSAAKKGCVNDDSIDCKKAQYNCDKPGKTAAWPGDSNIYYVCHIKRTDDGGYVTYPLLYRCQNNYEFNGEKCVKKAMPKPPPSQ